MQKDTVAMLMRLHDAGISSDDALTLRRCSMTLHRWHELECGNSNTWGSWCITRGAKVRQPDKTCAFVHDDDGRPHIEHHHYRHGNGADYVTYRPIHDREKGARKRIAAIVARYPGLQAYVQGDPRGCALYILRPGDVPEGADVSSCYNRGVAVHK